MSRIVRDFLLLRSRRALDLLDVGRLMGRGLGVGGVRRRIMGLGRGLGGRRLVRRLRMVLLVVMLRVVGVLDGARARVVLLGVLRVLRMLGVMGRRRQALGRVGVMLVRHPSQRSSVGPGSGRSNSGREAKKKEGVGAEEAARAGNIVVRARG